MVFKIRLSVSYKFIEKRGFCILYEKNLYFMRKATEIVVKSLEEWGLPEKGHPNAFKRVVGDFYCMKKPVQMFEFD